MIFLMKLHAIGLGCVRVKSSFKNCLGSGLKFCSKTMILCGYYPEKSLRLTLLCYAYKLKEEQYFSQVQLFKIYMSLRVQ